MAKVKEKNLRQKSNQGVNRGVPKGTEVAGNALNGWLPRRADTFELVGRIGQGAYSKVYKARDTVLNKVVALKKVCFDNQDPESVRFMAREIIILRRLGDHPNVTKLEGLAISRYFCSLYLVFDCMEYDLKGIQEQKDFGLSTFSDPEHSIPLTSKIVTLWYRSPELFLGSNSYGIGVDLWGVGCVLGELFTGKPIMPGRIEVEQLYKIFRLCGSPSDDFWSSILSNASVFKPRMPYKRQIQLTFHDLPASAVGLLDTLLSIEAEYRGTAAHALQGELFTTEPFACDPSSLPQFTPSKEIHAKKIEIKGRRVRKYARDRSVRAIPAAEANAELKSNIDRRRLLNHSKVRNRLEKTTEYVSGGALNEGTNSSECFQVSSRKEGSENHTLSSATPNQRGNQRTIRKELIHDDLDIKGKKKWSGPLPAPSDKMQDLLREHDAMILKTVMHTRLEKGSTAKGNDHVSKGKRNLSLGPSTSTNDHISMLLPVKWTNMQGLPREHEARILKDAQWVMFDKKKMSEEDIEQLSPPGKIR